MKKTLLLMLTLLCSVMTWADVTTHAMSSYADRVVTDNQQKKWDLVAIGTSVTIGASNEFTASIPSGETVKRGLSVAKASEKIAITSQSSFTNLTKVVVYASANGGTTGNVSVKVGSTSMTAPQIVSLSSGDKNKTFEFTSTTPLSGKIEVSLPYTTTKTVWFGGVTITTSTGSDTPATEQFSYTLETVGQGSVVFKDANNNTIAPNQKVDKDTKITPTFTPADGYEFTSWEYYTTAGSWSKLTGNDFTITKDVKFRVTFTETQSGGDDGDDEDGDNLTVTYNFNDKDAYPEGFPTGGTNKAEAKIFKISGNDIIINAPDAYYTINSTTVNRGLFFGKTSNNNGKPQSGTAYLGFPAKKGYKLTKVVATSTSGIAGGLPLNVYTTSLVAVSTALNTVNGAKTVHTFDINEPAENTEYWLTAGGSSGKNLQFDNIVLTYEEVAPTSTTITIGSTGYSTYFDSEHAYTMPEDCEGYVFTLDNGFEVAYEGGEVVPAGEPLVIYTIEPGDKTLEFTTTEEETYKSGDMNDLDGTDAETALEADDSAYFYALSKGKAGSQYAGKIGFFWLADNGAAFTNGAHKAYLKVAKTATSKSAFTFDGEATAISNVKADANTAVSYNLAGQRVNANVKGIVIMNGKKFINK